MKRLAMWAVSAVCGGALAGVIAAIGADRWTNRDNPAPRQAKARTEWHDVWGTD